MRHLSWGSYFEPGVGGFKRTSWKTGAFSNAPEPPLEKNDRFLFVFLKALNRYEKINFWNLNRFRG